MLLQVPVLLPLGLHACLATASALQMPHLQLCHLLPQLGLLLLCLRRLAATCPLPLDVVLGLLLYQADALQDVGDVVDTSLLDLQARPCGDGLPEPADC